MNVSLYYLFFLRMRSLLGVEVLDRENRALAKLFDLEKVIITQCTSFMYLERKIKYPRMGLVGHMAEVQKFNLKLT